MGKTSIEWTDYSWNPMRAELLGTETVSIIGHYCEKVSPGCANCYASRYQRRRHMPEFPGKRTEEQRGGGPVGAFLDPKRLLEPLTWRKPRRVFVCDMSDLFGAWVRDEWLDKVFAVMALTPHITYQVLTKRPERMAEYLSLKAKDGIPRRSGEHHPHRSYMALIDMLYSNPKLNFRPRGWPLPNVWLGTSSEDQARAAERIPHLLKCPAAVRFLSCEPLLGLIEIPGEHFGCTYCTLCGNSTDYTHETTVNANVSDFMWTCGYCSKRGHRGRRPPMVGWGKIDWVIVGGESGPGARPMHPDWGGARSGISARPPASRSFTNSGGSGPLFDHDYDVYADPRYIAGTMDQVFVDNGGAFRELVGSPSGRHGIAMNRVGKKAAGRLLDGREWSEFPNVAGVAHA